MQRNALVIGCGNIGSVLDEGRTGEVALTHAAGYQLHEGTRLVAGVDTDEDRRLAFQAARDVPAYGELEEALEQHDVDLVSVCTPPETHATLVELSLEARVDGILCEKPVADDSKAGKRVVERCREAGVPLAVNYTRRYLPGCRLARALLRSGLVGESERAVVVYSKGALDNGSHMIDLARWWFGEAGEVEAVGRPEPDGTIQFGGTRCHLVHTGNWAYNHVQADVYGDGGRLQLLDHGGRLQWQTVRDSTRFEGFKELGPAEAVETGLEWMCYFAVDDLVAAVDGAASLACDGEEALRTLELCERLVSG